MTDDVRLQVLDFIGRELLFGDRSRLPRPGDALLGTGGVVDSVGLNQLIAFVESQFGIAVDDLEIVPENFGTLDALCAYVARKRK